MADNVQINSGSGPTVRTLAESGGTEWQAVVAAYATTVSAGANVLQVVTPSAGMPTNLIQIGGSTPSASNFLPARLTDGTSYLASGTEYSEGDTAATPKGSMAMWAAGTTVHAVSTANPMPISQRAAGSASATLQNAVSATGNGSTLSTDGQSSVVFTITGTFTATIFFEGTEDGTNYTALTVSQLGTSTLATSTTTGGVFQASCAGLQNVRARVTWTSGTSVTVTAHAVPVSHPHRVVQANQAGTWTVQAAQSGTWTVQPGNTQNTTPWLVTESPAATGGLSVSKVISAATTNGTSVKASAGQVYSYAAFNNGAAPRYLKLYNKASSPTVGTDTPVAVFMIPAGGGAAQPLPGGLAFSTGIALAVTGGIADTDTTATAANECAVNVFYK